MMTLSAPKEKWSFPGNSIPIGCTVVPNSPKNMPTSNLIQTGWVIFGNIFVYT